MNSTIDSNRTTRITGTRIALRVSAALGLAAVGLTLAGAIGGHDTNMTHAQPTAVAIERAAPEAQFIYYIVDSQQAATNAVIAESVTAQERFMAGIVTPERTVRVIDDSDAGHITAAEAMLAAQ